MVVTLLATTSYQAISLSSYMQNKGKVSSASLAPVVVCCLAAYQRTRGKLSNSTVEFVYMSPPQDLNYFSRLINEAIDHFFKS